MGICTSRRLVFLEWKITKIVSDYAISGRVLFQNLAQSCSLVLVTWLVMFLCLFQHADCKNDIQFWTSNSWRELSSHALAKIDVSVTSFCLIEETLHSCKQWQSSPLRVQCGQWSCSATAMKRGELGMQMLALGTRITISNSGTLCWYNCLHSCTIDWRSDLGWKVILKKNKIKCWFIFNCDPFPSLIHGEAANSCTSAAELSGRVLLMLFQMSKDCLVQPWSEEITEGGNLAQSVPERISV